MRPALDPRLEAGRVKIGRWGSHAGYGRNGAFAIAGPCGTPLRILATDGLDPEAEGWEHVSVSARRMPNWVEMSFVKGLFWLDEECVVEFHPPRSAYVSNHPNCLHLWRHVWLPVPTPPSYLVGAVSGGELTKAEAAALSDLQETLGRPLTEAEARQLLDRGRPTLVRSD